jgi:sugar (pentulose or hexulose) kinase
VVVLDVGKTNAKLTLWDEAGVLLERRSRANLVVQSDRYRVLDAVGVEAWLVDTLSDFADQAEVGAIIPVAHGAAAALIHDGRLWAPPMDYEEEPDPADRAVYDRSRDAFALTGSPRLPQGLNLGMQLHRLERLTGPWPLDLQIVTWPQYWAWLLCGQTATELTSLGCHTDLWRPGDACPSAMAITRGWAQRLAPLRAAADVLGPIGQKWAKRTGLPVTCQIHCGLHDSNAALLAARGHAEIAAGDATILSTGTWFVAMRSLTGNVEARDLVESRDCLINVDADGRPAPSARFMGGREAELLAGTDIFALTENYDPEVLIGRLPSLIERGVFALPGAVRGVGPFPDGPGGWENEPDDELDRRAAAGLYLALMADVVLDLVGSRERLVIEGRFAEAQLFVRALAALRPRQNVYVSNAQDDVSYGALRLLRPGLASASPLTPTTPLPLDLSRYVRRWRAFAERG